MSHNTTRIISNILLYILLLYYIILTRLFFTSKWYLVVVNLQQYFLQKSQLLVPEGRLLSTKLITPVPKNEFDFVQKTCIQ